MPRAKLTRYRQIAHRIPLVLVLVTAACGPSGPVVSLRPSSFSSVPSIDLDTAWSATVAAYLRDPLWTDRDAYDAAHYLMVPVHAAFEIGDRDWQQALDDHFSRFLRDGVGELTLSRIDRLQYLYLVSEYAILAQGEAAPDLIDGLRDLLETEVTAFWAQRPAWQWGASDFRGIRERLAWKLGHTDVSRSYYRAIVDEELLLFAIAADLRQLERAADRTEPPAVGEILSAAETVFTQEVTWQSDGGWLLQPGVWTDHPDYAYAGRDTVLPEMSPAPVAGIAWDSSHSHRLPLILASLERAAGEGEPLRLYQSLISGLAGQFERHVLVPPDDTFAGYRLTNFMDGRNGVYRWSYPTQGAGKGYGPYELSGTFLLGWWAFLHDEAVCSAYRETVQRFPLSEDQLSTYVGPNTTRARHPLVADPASYTNGFRQLLVALAARIC